MFKVPIMSKVLLLLRPNINSCITRTLMCRAVRQQMAITQTISRTFNPRQNALQLVLKRQCFRYNKSEVNRDILLYKNKTFWLFRLVGIFIVAQGGFWSYVLYNTVTANIQTRRFVAVKYGPEGVPEELKNFTSWQGLNYKMASGAWVYIVPMICVTAGVLIVIGGLIYCRKNVHAIVLKKGGEMVTIYKYGFFGRLSSFTIPLSRVSAQHGRHAVRQHLPVAVKGHRFNYIIDKDGKYYNAKLFDNTVGVHRSIGK